MQTSALADRLDGVIADALQERRIVGAVVMVSHAGEPVYHRAAGLADREAGIPMREDAIFRLASVTKPFVSAAAMRLVEDGRLTLDTPVSDYLPDFRPRLADNREPTITVFQLLTHTAGLGYRFLMPEGSDYHRLNVSDGLDQPGLSVEANLARLADTSLLFPPGEGWCYSLSIDVLGALLEKASGARLGDVVKELVTGPLHLNDTRFDVSDVSRLVKPYADGVEEPVPMFDGIAVELDIPPQKSRTVFAPSRALNPASYHSGGAGMVGTADEVSRFLEAIRKGGDPLLTADTVSLMMRDHVGALAQLQDPGWGFGLGWAVLNDPTLSGTPQAKGTIQWGGAYGHAWFVDPDNELTVVALTNTAFEGMAGRFPIEIRDAVYGK